MNNCKDLTGHRFGKLVVISREPNNKWRNSMWLCKCDCGKTTIVNGSRLTSGHTRSCGCLQREKGDANLKLGGKSVKKHGLSKTRLYNIHRGMLDRCYNSKNNHFNDYGGRGIIVCDEWKDAETGIYAFSKWALDNGYKEDLTLDRIDNNGNYEPQNCRWATKSTQARNRRSTINNRLITYKGETHTVFEWLELLGIRSIHYEDKD